MSHSYLFTSESVSEGHPDKVADRISDTVLDAFLAADPYSRVACETLVTTNRIVLAGEHASYYGGWMEGSLLSALDAIERIHQRATGA